MAKRKKSRPDRRLERALRKEGFARIAGVDEAGAGPLAGPVVAAAVVLPVGPGRRAPAGMDDSKKLSHEQRARIVRQLVLGGAADFGVGIATVEEIEQVNILHARMLAMRRALSELQLAPDLVLVDGNREVPEIPMAQRCCVKGDALHACIAAASILAKETRDNYMRGAAERFPHYGFERHKGYGTEVHVEAIRTHGPCEIHRPSFLTRILE